jgi:hypothetical protein
VARTCGTVRSGTFPGSRTGTGSRARRGTRNRWAPPRAVGVQIHNVEIPKAIRRERKSIGKRRFELERRYPPREIDLIDRSFKTTTRTEQFGNLRRNTARHAPGEIPQLCKRKTRKQLQRDDVAVFIDWRVRLRPANDPTRSHRWSPGHISLQDHTGVRCASQHLVASTSAVQLFACRNADWVKC